MLDTVCEAADFILPHYNSTKLADIPKRIKQLKRFGKPIICNEDDKTGHNASRAAELSVEHGAWYRAHDTETVTIWINDQAEDVYRKKSVPVDMGGTANVLTYDDDMREIYIAACVNGQGGCCEVSKCNPPEAGECLVTISNGTNP